VLLISLSNANQFPFPIGFMEIKYKEPFRFLFNYWQIRTITGFRSLSAHFSRPLYLSHKEKRKEKREKKRNCPILCGKFTFIVCAKIYTLFIWDTEDLHSRCMMGAWVPLSFSWGEMENGIATVQRHFGPGSGSSACFLFFCIHV
jgi:hypothetical protein